MTLTQTFPSSEVVSGVSQSLKSSYPGSMVLSASGKSTQICNPKLGAPSLSGTGISECMIPLPAVMNCKSPGYKIPLAPVKSS
ncbi:P35 protein, partial [Candida maltosa Xu316]